jgi:hypothetical protein
MSWGGQAMRQLPVGLVSGLAAEAAVDVEPQPVEAFLVDRCRVQQVRRLHLSAGLQVGLHAGADAGSVRLERAAGERQGGDQQLAGCQGGAGVVPVQQCVW